MEQLLQEIETHISVLNEEFGQISVELAMLKERVDWLCKFFWITITAIIGIGITQVWQLVILKRNGKK